MILTTTDQKIPRKILKGGGLLKIFLHPYRDILWELEFCAVIQILEVRNIYQVFLKK